MADRDRKARRDDFRAERRDSFDRSFDRRKSFSGNNRSTGDRDRNENKKPMGFMQSCCDLIIYFIYSL